MNILICEDERIIALSEKSVLEAAGYTVDIASTGEQALQMLAGGSRPALILMDIDLGSGMDGTGTAQQIGQRYDIPVVFLSSHTEPDVVEKTEGITSYGYVVKNTGDTVLLASIRMAFRLFESRQRRKRAEEQLREQNRYLSLYRTAVDGMDDHKIAVVDSGYRYQVVSRQFAESYSRPESEIIGGTIADLVGEFDFTQKIQPYIDRGLAGTPTEFDDWFAFPALGHRHMRVRYYPLPGFGSAGSAVAVVIQDITERTQIERSARTAQRHLDVIFDSVPAAIWFTDPEGRYVRVNKAWSESVGIAQKDAIGKTAFDVFPSDLAQRLATEEAGIVQTGTPIRNHVMPHVTLSGEEGWSRTDRLPTTDDTGAIIGVVGFAVDITAERSAVLELEKAHARTDAILSAHPDIVFVTDSEGTILEFHTRATELLATTDLDGQSITTKLPDDISALVSQAIREAYDTGELQVIDYELEVPAGKRFFEDRLVRLDDGRVLGIVRDITARRNAELEVRKLLSEKENLVREVQHRIKNTMNTMGAVLSLHADAVEDSPAAHAALTDARSRFRSMEVLYDQLYRADAHDSGSLKRYLQHVVDTIVALFPSGSRVAVTTDIEDQILSTAVLSPLGMIVTELVTNAMKYAASDAPTLLVRARSVETTLRVTVADNGPGLPSDVADGASDGFGLRMIRVLAEQLSASLTFSLEHGTSVTLAFDLPPG